MPAIQLFSTSGCHLCEQAAELLAQIARETPIDWREIEIADSDTLIERYGVRIPVVREAVTGEELGWPFDIDRLRAWLQARL